MENRPKIQMESTSIGQIADVQTGPFGSQLHKEDYVLYGTPIVTVEHLGEKSFSKQNLPYVSDKDVKRLEKYTMRPGDIIFSRVGSVDRCSFATENNNGWLFSGRCLRLRVTEANVLPEYLYYFFCQESVKELIRNRAVGATMPSLNTKLISELQFVYPEKEKQIKIISFLSNIDDKIELNTQINHNLEEQAKAIFKSWFVDFEPFRDGKFVDSELGPIPEGWSVSPLDEIADYVNGLPMQKYRPTEGEDSLPVLKIKELRENSCSLESERCSASINKEYVVDDGDVVFSWSGSLLVDIWTGGKCGLNQHLFKVTSSIYDKWYYYLWTGYHLHEFVAIAADKATTMGHIQRSHLHATLVTVSPPNQYQKISAILTPIIDKIISNRVESHRLAVLRDTLLPKLMSGEIDVSEIEV